MKMKDDFPQIGGHIAKDFGGYLKALNSFIDMGKRGVRDESLVGFDAYMVVSCKMSFRREFISPS